MRRVLAPAAVAVLALVACASPEEEAAFSRPPLITLTDGSQAVDRGEAEAAGGAVTIRMAEFSFQPTVIRAPAGSVVQVRLVNAGDNVHNFEIAEQGIDRTLAERTEESVSVTVPRAGAVTFSCKFHLPRAMRGEFRAA
ncbi:MAG: cupredoxin domain-containing protein [Actinomycetota bacterium]